MAESRAQDLHFDPDHHPNDLLKAFSEFVQDFELRYDAKFPDPPKVSLDSAMERWKLLHEDKKPSLTDYDSIVDEWKSRDKVAKFLGIYSSRRMYSDWKAAEPSEKARKESSWEEFVGKMETYYKPTENLTLKNFMFRSLVQEKNETFIAFCNRVGKEAKHCQFTCDSEQCTAEKTAIRDQIVIGTINDEIREEALKKSWPLDSLRSEGMRMESASKSASAIAGDASLNRMGKYSFKNMKKKDEGGSKKVNCFFCGTEVEAKNIAAHSRKCPAKSATCGKCKKVGHVSKVCKSEAAIQEVSTEVSDNEDSAVYNVNIFRLQKRETVQAEICNDDFNVQLVINNHLDSVLADTGAKVSVCSLKQAKKWDLVDRMIPSKVRIKPYKSPVIPAVGESRCSVSFGERSVPVVWHIIKEDCEPVLSGMLAKSLGIIKFQPQPESFMPIKMIKLEAKQTMQDILCKYPQVFKGTGKLRGHQVNLLVDPDVKSVAEPPRRIPYHLKDRVDEKIDEMLRSDVIEEHPTGQPAPWVSNIVIAPKDDGDIRITLDAKNLNKAVQASNFPIPRQEDIKVKLSGAKLFSKLDLKAAFWQLELAPESRHYTIFHANGKLYRYKRLVMGIKSAQGELNAALQPLFAHLPQVHIIHDDLVIATVTLREHEEVVKAVMGILAAAGLTLNPPKCVFGKKEIRFWGMIVGAEGIQPDPEKVEALSHISPPRNKDELNSFICMMQSNAEFIPEFAQKVAKLRELTKKSAKFNWKTEHQSCFEHLLERFKKETLLQYFDGRLQSYLFVDAHYTGLGSILAQGTTIDDARPVAIASRATSKAEKHYPQLDLEGLGVDFALRRFREYLVGSPSVVTVVTDHKPLVPIFNQNKRGSIRTHRVKLRHQDIPYVIEYRKGKLNQSDFISRHSKPLEQLSVEQRAEPEELNNLLYALHTTPVMDCIGLSTIAKETAADSVLSKIVSYVKKGQTWIPKTDQEAVQKFKTIMSELTVTGNGILLKDDRVVLPSSLQSKAVELAHQGAHPGQGGMERRLRCHFFFHDMFGKVDQYLKTCKTCACFVDKKTKEPLDHHKVPAHCWDTVAVDLFGPMPSSKHIVVVHDLASRLPAAKLVKSTRADSVLPALSEIYGVYGNPQVQISDNGPPFSSKKMSDFAAERDITLRFTPPYHPNANPAETCMKPLGKAMKAAHYNGQSEEEALRRALNSYKQTPHIATGVPPASMLFRDGIRSEFPRKAFTENEITTARQKDLEQKERKQEEVNSSKYRKQADLLVGETVLIRNSSKTSKFQPTFTPDLYEVLQADNQAKKLMLRKWGSGSILIRHPDDVKRFSEEVNPPSLKKEATPDIRKEIEDEIIVRNQEDDDAHSNPLSDTVDNPLNVAPERNDEQEPRRSSRRPIPNRRYYNDDYE